MSLCISTMVLCIEQVLSLLFVQCQLLERFPEESGAKDPAARMIPFLPGECVCVCVCVCVCKRLVIHLSLGKKLFGRSHIRTVAEKRKEKIDLYCRVSQSVPVVCRLYS